MDDDNEYLLLTPGPLTTSPSVKRVMMRDHCTWDDDYNEIVTHIREELVTLAGGGDCTSVLMQGSGTFAVEATMGTVIPAQGKVLVVNNGAYGKRIVQICERLNIDHTQLSLAETEPASSQHIAQILEADPKLTHVAVVHCETTTGLLNPITDIGAEVRSAGRTYIVDAMSSFGGIPITMESTQADFLISSANKCIQGVPGFGFVVARREQLAATAGQARSLSLDLHAQWAEMEAQKGKWRFTSPTHVVLAFQQALRELASEGGVAARYARYQENHRLLVNGMEGLGFRPLISAEHRSPIITSFRSPEDDRYVFREFYDALKSRGFVIYPGKVSQAETFRIGTIGHLFPQDVERLIAAIQATIEEQGLDLGSRPVTG